MGLRELVADMPAKAKEETIQKCLFCDRTATKLCDFILGMKGVEIEERTLRPRRTGEPEPFPTKRLVFDTGDKMETYTCDAPLCDVHAVAGEVTFYCGGGDASFCCGGGESISETDTGINVDDYCPIHPSQNHGNIRPMRRWEANRERMAMRLRASLKVQRRYAARWLD